MREKLLERGPGTRRAILLSVVVGVPTLFLRSGMDPINVPKLALLMSGVAVVSALRVAELLQEKERDLGSLQLLVIPASALFVPLLLGWMFAAYRGWSLFGQYGRFQGLIPYAAVILAGILMADAFRGRAHQLAWALLAAGGVVGGYALVQVAGLDPFEWQLAGRASSDATSTLGNSNFVGGFLGIVLPLGIGLALWDVERRALASGLSAVVLAGCVVAQSQGGWGAALGGISVTLGFYLSARWAPMRILGLAGAGLVFAVSVGIVLFSIANPRSATVPGTIQLRGYAWEAAAGTIAGSPVVGRGPNAFAVEGVQHRSVEDARRFAFNFPDDPHSVPLSLAVGGGLVAIVGYGVLVFWLFSTGLRTARRGILAAGFFGAALAYLTQSFVSIDEASLRLAFWVCLAGLAAVHVEQPRQAGDKPGRRKRRRKVQEPVRGIPGIAAVTLFALAVMWWSVSLVVADARILEGTRAFVDGDVTTGDEKFSAARGFWDNHNYRRFHGFYLGRAAISAGTEGEDLLERSRDYHSFLRDFPDVAALNDYGRILSDWGTIDPSANEEAVQVFERMVSLDPLNPLIRVGLTRALADTGRGEEALEVIAPSLEIAGRKYPEVYGAAALAHAVAGNTSEARAFATQALEIDPEEGLALRAQSLVGSP